MKVLKKLILATALAGSCQVLASDITYSAYGTTKAQAQSSIHNYASRNNYTVLSINCYSPQMGPPWQCDGRLRKKSTTPPAGEIIKVSAWGYSEANATANAISAWRSAANSTKTPGVYCKYWAVGPGWQCFAQGRA
ncbi:hypothetical protein [Pseudoalteromonas luteoviolacea]|uniref:Uncharacterized protein n=1 Tax=Pseudoalteromonas luteoviolacea DSM 6061 TaxID=1365250 RepID=A0A166V5E1_9GAMM|nr:hypothetical protein [Pseudoalteromonas luteoviolacea]KZN31734.1 hypothetical protein N475_04565 [Pseudoalteromonas luteoviolacea DSM 6061]MBE0389071.1 hypothetical protein [Pseudoalteromonas luteoviolacea DSM 6061]TQF70426.1 hypothetical protein FLM44_04840 [Pseudoalteromonas luteoviolacea]